LQLQMAIDYVYRKVTNGKYFGEYFIVDIGVLSVKYNNNMSTRYVTECDKK